MPETLTGGGGDCSRGMISNPRTPYMILSLRIKFNLKIGNGNFASIKKMHSSAFIHKLCRIYLSFRNGGKHLLGKTFYSPPNKVILKRCILGRKRIEEVLKFKKKINLLLLFRDTGKLENRNIKQTEVLK